MASAKSRPSWWSLVSATLTPDDQLCAPCVFKQGTLFHNCDPYTAAAALESSVEAKPVVLTWAWGSRPNHLLSLPQISNVPVVLSLPQIYPHCSSWGTPFSTFHVPGTRGARVGSLGLLLCSRGNLLWNRSTLSWWLSTHFLPVHQGNEQHSNFPLFLTQTTRGHPYRISGFHLTWSSSRISWRRCNLKLKTKGGIWPCLIPAKPERTWGGDLGAVGFQTAFTQRSPFKKYCVGVQYVK